MKNRLVTLKSFNGTSEPEDNTSDSENYWKLLGTKGRIIEDKEYNHRVLVLFECNLDEYHLENHNPIKNSLWINFSDLKVEDEDVNR